MQPMTFPVALLTFGSFSRSLKHKIKSHSFKKFWIFFIIWFVFSCILVRSRVNFYTPRFFVLILHKDIYFLGYRLLKILKLGKIHKWIWIWIWTDWTCLISLVLRVPHFLYFFSLWVYSLYRTQYLLWYIIVTFCSYSILIVKCVHYVHIFIKRFVKTLNLFYVLQN